MTTIQKRLLGAIFCLLLLFIFLASTAYTIDITFRTEIVRWLTGCRVLLLITGCAFLCTLGGTLVRDVDLLAIIVSGIILVGAVAGLFGMGGWPTYLRHGFQYGFILVFYLIGRHVARIGIRPWQMNLACVTAIVGYAISTVIYALTPGLQSGAYSFQPDLALLPLSYNYSAAMSAASGFLIVIGNKRAVFVGACFCLAALTILAISRRTNVLRFPIREGAILALTPVITVLAASILSATQIPMLGMVANRFSAEPSFIDANTKKVLTSPPLPASPGRPQGGSTGPATSPPDRQQGTTEQVENNTERMVRLTSARNIEAEAVWNLIKSAPIGVLVGAGFGAGFEMKYTSPNDYQPVSFWRDQADVMPVHIAMTSGLPLAILFSIALFVTFSRMFLRLAQLVDIDRAVVLFSLSIPLDLVLGFTATNPIIWSSIGYAAMRTLGTGAQLKT
ncbi:MAG: hypothetical protein QOH96_1331 [Blastocatellia bacterium]|nr:hypothetical protein [Blastocatellia bacterium]